MSAHGRSLINDMFGIIEGRLSVGGRGVEQFAQAHGTPLFIYDAALLRGRLALLRAHLPDCVDVYYSVKANPNPAVISCFVEQGAGTEIASAAEYLRARAAGCGPERILFAGPGKGVEELRHVVAGGIGEIHVETTEEIEALGRIASDAARDVTVAVRVNPVATASGGAMRMGGQPAAFGFDEECLEQVVACVRSHSRLRLGGIHMFAGTQILDADALVGQWSHAVDLGRRLHAITGAPPVTVDLGGGLGIPYFAKDSPLDLARVEELAGGLFSAAIADPALDRTRFVVEPGRFLAGPCGVYLTRVLSVKVSRGTTFVVLDGGMHHHLAASGNLGQVIKRDYPIVNATRVVDAPTLDAVVVGPLCTPLDTLGRKTKLPAATKPGDLVAVLQSGAYGLTASPVGFLSHPMPAEVMIDGGAVRRIRERGTFAQPTVPLP